MLNHSQNKYFIAMLALLVVPISGLSIDIYVPSLPAVSHYFATSKAMVQLSITIYMVGLGVMQLFAGSISDSFGRKKPFAIAMLIYIIATLFVPLSQNIYQLLLLRLIQGLTVAVTVVPMRSVIADLFQGREFYKMATYMTMAWSIGPIIAPAIGGYLQHYFNWQANFYFLAIYCIVIFTLTLIYLPETSQYRHAFKPREILKRYYEIFSHREFISSLLIDGLLYSITILFSIVGPFLIQTVLHYSAVEFGQIALLMGFAWFLGTMTNRIIIHIDIYVKAKVCLFIMLIISLIMFSLVLISPTHLYSMMIPMFLLYWVGGIIFPNYFAHCIALFPKTTGSSNALFGAFIFFIAGASSGLGTLLKSTSALPLVGADVVLVSLCLIIYYINKSKISEKVT